VEFRRDEKGQILWYFADTLYPEFEQRNVLWQPIGSYKHILKINKEVVRRGIQVLDRVLVTDLLTNNERVQGAVGCDTREGNFYVFNAKAVVIASGGFSGGGIGNWPSLTGDGIAMGLRAGAELRGMEFGKAEAGGVLMDRGWPVWIFVLLNPQEEGIAFTNVKGEEFLEKYELGRRLPGRKYYGPPFRVQLMAMLKELREGRGPCYVDYRTPNKVSRLRDFWGSFFDRTLKQIELTGTTLDQAKYELAIARGFNQSGGIRINLEGQSSVAGLYAAGQSSDMCGTVQYAILSGMMSSMITARRAGESAAKDALNQPQLRKDEEQIENFRESIYSPLLREKGITSDEIRMKTIRAWLNVDLREEKRLIQAHNDFRHLKEEASNLKANNHHELVKCHKMSNYLECSDAVAVAALARKETRLEHIREDYPLTDNKEWLKWIIVQRLQDDLHARLEDIPIHKWRYRPEPVVVNRLRLRSEG
jgi:succinate dehydrogenase/fumarate reductase flavoprotein subunit